VQNATRGRPERIRGDLTSFKKEDEEFMKVYRSGVLLNYSGAFVNKSFSPPRSTYQQPFVTTFTHNNKYDFHLDLFTL
jgi:hypothetical protein